MKNWLILLAVVFLHNSAFSQGNQLSLGEVLETLNNMEVFVKNRKLKKEIINQMEAIDDSGQLTIEQYQKLESAYGEMAYYYNKVYLAEIKADLSNFKTIKKMLKRPG